MASASQSLRQVRVELFLNMKLSIIIPTFNRLNKAAQQIQFLSEERARNKSSAQFFLSDNASDKNVSECLEEASGRHGFTYRRNEENLGLVGNLIASINATDGDYTWLVGDDDSLSEGILNKVLDKLVTEQPDLLFINHYATDGITGKVVMESALPSDWQNKTSGTMLDVYKHSGTTMMFITACVYKTSLLKKAIRLDRGNSKRLTAPLYWSLFCAQDNRVSYITTTEINNVWNTHSWKEDANRLFSVSVPEELQKCLGMRYGIRQTLPIYIKMQIRLLVNRLRSRVKR